MNNSGNYPILTFGFERSGTTLLSMLLGSHPNLAVPFSPTGLWYQYFFDLDNYEQIQHESDRDRLIRDILQEKRIQMWDVAPDFDEVKARSADSGYGRVVAAFHELYAERHNKSRWALHDIGTLYNMHIANQWFPDARFLHIVRDVRDVAFSHKGYRYGSSNACEVALAWREAVRTNLMMGKMLGPERYILIRFEDLIDSAEKTLGQVCEFFGIEFEKTMLDYSDDVHKKVPQGKKFLWPALGGELDRSKIGQWQNKLKSREISAIDEIAGDVMLECGYEPASVSSNVSKELYFLGSVLSRGGRIGRLKRLFKLGKKSAAQS